MSQQRHFVEGLSNKKAEVYFYYMDSPLLIDLLLIQIDKYETYKYVLYSGREIWS